MGWTYLLGTILVVLAAGTRLPGARNPWTSGLGAAFLFLINPVVLLSLFPFGLNAIDASLFFAGAFVAAWLWMEHWSGFMRSLMLMLLFAAGLWLGARSTFWIGLALVPWVLFNRRPWLASASLATIVLGGSLLYEVTRSLSAFWFHTPGGMAYPWLQAELWLQSIWPAMAEFSRQNGPAVSHHLAAHLDRVTLGWSLMAFAIIGRRLQSMMAQRRSDITAFMATLSAIAFGASLGHPEPSSVRSALAVFVAVTAPLVASEFSARDYMYNRSARIAAGIGILCGALAIVEMGWSLWASALGILLAGIFSLLLPSTQKLVHRVRWRAVLLGCSVGASLSAAVEMYLKLFT